MKNHDNTTYDGKRRRFIPGKYLVRLQHAYGHRHSIEIISKSTEQTHAYSTDEPESGFFNNTQREILILKYPNYQISYAKVEQKQQKSNKTEKKT
jgi:hypothetical protein